MADTAAQTDDLDCPECGFVLDYDVTERALMCHRCGLGWDPADFGFDPDADVAADDPVSD